MKSILPLFLAIALLTSTACSNTKSVLQDATGATTEQAEVIDEWLESASIEYESIEASSNPLTKNMDNGWKAYDLTSKGGNTFLLILRKEDNDFTAVFDSEGDLLAGLIDNSVLPAYYKANEKQAPLLPSETTPSISLSDASTMTINLTAPLPLSKNHIVLSDENDCYVNIEMINGSYSYFSAGGGSYGNNFSGSYQVRVYTENLTGDQTDLYTAPISLEGDTVMTFGDNDSLGAFSLIFDDYNADGNLDFTLGQWGSSNGNMYKLFSVYHDGRVVELDTEGLIFISNFDFSIALDKESDTSFSKVWYDNSKGINMKTVYEWKDDKFVVISDEPA